MRLLSWAITCTPCHVLVTANSLLRITHIIPSSHYPGIVMLTHTLYCIPFILPRCSQRFFHASFRKTFTTSQILSLQLFKPSNWHIYPNIHQHPKSQKNHSQNLHWRHILSSIFQFHNLYTPQADEIYSLLSVRHILCTLCYSIHSIHMFEHSLLEIGSAL